MAVVATLAIMAVATPARGESRWLSVEPAGIPWEGARLKLGVYLSPQAPVDRLQVIVFVDSDMVGSFPVRTGANSILLPGPPLSPGWHELRVKSGTVTASTRIQARDPRTAPLLALGALLAITAAAAWSARAALRALPLS